MKATREAQKNLGPAEQRFALLTNKNRVVHALNIVNGFNAITNIMCTPSAATLSATLSHRSIFPPRFARSPELRWMGRHTQLVDNYLRYATSPCARLSLPAFAPPSRLSTLYVHLTLAHVGPMIDEMGDIHLNSTEAAEALNSRDSSWFVLVAI